MSIQHKDLSLGRWNKFSFFEQMANIGSEIERSLNWRKKNNAEYSQKASDRSLELIDLTLDDAKNAKRFRELARLREAVVDYFYGENQYVSSEASWRKYFSCFTYAARRKY